MGSLNTEGSAVPARAPRLAWVLASAAAAGAWLALVAASPPRFFALGTVLCLAWAALSIRAAPVPASPPRRTPRAAAVAADLAIGVASGALLWAGSRAFLWGACGGLTRVLCGPVAEMFERFETGTLGAALALALVFAPAEELFWRGVVQARLAPRLGPARAVVAATLAAALASLATGEALLALAMLPTYGAWGALAAWRRSLVPAIASHATWSVLVTALLPPG